ncbi:MAG: 4Fe-4S binding protein [Bacillota bacterium]|nr:4Fe-4S binding protein [Bacillota bacterium]
MSCSTPRLLGPVAVSFNNWETGAWRSTRPSIEPAECAGCLLCAKYCPPGVVTVAESGGTYEVGVDLRYCNGCGICARVCPRRCIAMIPER